MSLNFLFNPKSIAVVGVSSDPSKLGSVVFTNMLSSGFEGNLYPVNPKYTEVYNRKCFAKLSDIPGDIDLVCIVVPPQLVNDILEDAGTKGVKGAVIITAGFAETGEQGAKLQEEIVETAKKHNIRVLGPNCLGLIVTKSKINLSFAATDALDGNIAFVSQSGAFLTAMLDMSLEKSLGFSHLISIGNKADLDENDFVKEWLDDPEIKAIGAYLEDLESGRGLIEIYKKSKTKKPLVIFKPGETQESQKAISSHTGSLAGSYEVFDTAMRQAGITIAKDINDMFNFLLGFSWSELPKGKNVAVVTNAGGPGVIATDYIVKNDLKLAEISEDTKKLLASVLPFNASFHNPVDVIGDANAERYRNTLDILIKEESIDAIFVLLTPQIVTEVEETAKVVINNSKMTNKPIIPVFLGGKYISFGLQKFYDEKIPAFKDISEAIETFAVLYNYVSFLENEKEQTEANTHITSKYLNKGKYKDEVSKYLSNNFIALPENLVTKLADEVRIILPKQVLTSTIEEAIEFAKDNYPVVIKATTEVIVHKTDEKALYLNINDEETLRKNYAELRFTIQNKFNIADPKILIQEQVKANEEIFVGANRDGNMDVYEVDKPGFGHLLAFGKGGIYTEVYKDIGYALAPSSRDDILKALKKTKVYEIIQGARGRQKLALEKLIDVIESVQKMVLLYPEIKSLDINPVLLTTDRAVTVDLKIFVSR